MRGQSTRLVIGLNNQGPRLTQVKMKQHFATGDFGDDHNVNKDTKTDGVKTDTTRRPFE